MSFIPKGEIDLRISRLRSRISEAGLDAVFVSDGVEQLYYAGTIQNGVLVVPAENNGDVVYFVRRSIERASIESPLVNMRRYISFRDIAAHLAEQKISVAKVGIDETAMSISVFNMIRKNFPTTVFSDSSVLFKKIRAVKTEYEIGKMRLAGNHAAIINNKIVSMLREGITEWVLALELFKMVSTEGGSCIARLATGSGEFFLGNICFGDSALIPTAFDGPGGIAGRSPVCPYGGSERQLKKGDLVFIDIAYPHDEYYVDKTRLYSFGMSPSSEVLKAHAVCLSVQEFVRQRLKVGSIPSRIYEEALENVVVPSGLAGSFMGYGSNQVKFIGHGIGLVVNEYPVIARKFDEPLEAGMTIALEPKIGIAGIGLVGTENTFLVTDNGGECLTNGSDDIRIVG